MTIQQLEQKANDIRQDIIKMLVAAKSGHSAGPLDMADVFTALYFSVLNYDPKNSQMPLRDRFVLSAGHICPVWYATLAHAGFFPVSELASLRKLGTRLHGHPHNEVLPGSENSSGPLGQGISQAAGMALGFKIDNKKNRVFVVCGDGEQNEGNHWEAVMFAAKYKLANLTLFVDRNNIQIDGFTENVMPLEPLADKYKAFNWNVLEIDGHDFKAIKNAVELAKNCVDKPTAIIAKTIPGFGVSFMENKFEWHGKAPTEEEAEQALKELSR